MALKNVSNIFLQENLNILKKKTFLSLYPNAGQSELKRSVNFKRTFCYPQFFQKKREKNQQNYYDTSGRIVFIRFLKELKTQKRHFEIN